MIAILDQYNKATIEKLANSIFYRIKIIALPSQQERSSMVFTAGEIDVIVTALLSLKEQLAETK